MSTTPTYDLLIRGGTVIDGTKAPRFDADVAILDGRIAAIGELAGASARRNIDAAGLIVSPGFIDSHTHDDQALLAQPDMGFKVSQGVTTVIAGNCGISAAPLVRGMKLPMPLDLIDGPDSERHETFASWVAALSAKPAATNVAALVGHSTLRAATMKDLDREANAEEIAAMQALLVEALDAGAIGLSTGTFYPPALKASTAEIVAVGRPLTARGGLYVTHMRDESSKVMEALDETFRIGRELAISVVVSHHKVQNRPNFGRSEETLAFVRETMKGQSVCLDCYPYTAGSTMIRTDRGMLDGRVLIASSVPHPECAGRELGEIATEWGVSDGIPVGEKPHPRLWGTFPRVLGHYSRDVGLFPLETAVWKMTGLTARNFGLADRGSVAVGKHADLVLFDAGTVKDAATYEEPTRPAVGIHTVIVNGGVAWEGGRSTGVRRGRVLRRTPSATHAGAAA
jgi:N-acyl-D-amino-acid deacylase